MDSFDRFLWKQRDRCRLKAHAALMRVHRERHAAAQLAQEVVIVKGTYGGAPSPKIQHDRGIEWQVRQATEHR